MITGANPGRTINVDGKECLYFSGTSYLGMSHNAVFRDYLFRGFERYGTNYGNSRISNVQLDIYEEAEKYLAKQSGMEAAVTTSSGYLAGQMAFGLFADSDHIFYAPNVHPAVCSEKFLPFKGSFAQWRDYVIGEVKAITSGSIVLVSNTLDPLFLEPYNFDWLFDLPGEKNIVAILDDSHGYGIIGKEGGGIIAYLNKVPNITLIITASLGKACGIPGGLILSNRSIIGSLKSSSKIFAGGSPVSPAYLYAFLRSCELYKEALKKLRKNIFLFKKLTNGIDLFSSQPDFPAFYTSANELYESLKENEIIISSFPYPTKESPNITRIVLNSLHKEEDIERLASLVMLWDRTISKR